VLFLPNEEEDMSSTAEPARSARAPHLAFGAWGEEVAARHLLATGMVVLDRNWRCEAGEIDLVLRDGHDLVICEVKTRRSEVAGTPHEAVDARRVARLRRAGLAWLREHSARPREVRVDMVAVLAPRRGPVQLEHVRGIG
jgi:putative endonuclease